MSASIGLALCTLLIECCSREPSVSHGGVVVFDGVVPLTREARRDVSQREFTVTGAASFVAIVDEGEFSVIVRLERSREGAAPAAFAEVDSQYRESVEVAALDAEAGDRLVVKLTGPQHFDRVGQVRLRLLRFDLRPSGAPATLEAFRAWSRATSTDMSAESARTQGLPDFDRALAHFESPAGDPALAAWARLSRAWLAYNFMLGWEDVLRDARLARAAFERIGDARGAARARVTEATALVETANDSRTASMSPEQASAEADRILAALEHDPALTPLMRAHATTMRAVRAYNLNELDAAQEYMSRSLEALRAMGNRDLIIGGLSNLAAFATERGELREAVAIYDDLMARLDEVHETDMRAGIVHNAATCDYRAGNTDRAIERYLHLLEMLRERKTPQWNSRALQGLANSYRQRGDLAQARIFADESLRVQRQISDAVGLMLRLQTAGEIARDSGDFARALALHREALDIAATSQMRMRLLTQIARDHAAAGDHDRAIANYLASLALPLEKNLRYPLYPAQISLAESLLEKRNRGSRDLREAEELAQDVLRGAMHSANLSLEQSARKVLARIAVLRGDPETAREEYERSIALIFRYGATSASPEQRATGISSSRDTFQGYVDLMMRSVAARGPGKLLPVTAGEESALRVLEAARVLSFQALRLAQANPAALARIDELLKRMAEKRVQAQVVLERASTPERQLELLQLDIAKLRAEIDREIAAASAPAAARESAQVIAQPWPALAVGTTQLSYALGERHAYLWVRDASGIRAIVLARSPAWFERELARLAALDAVRSAAEFERSLSQLSESLLPDGAAAPGARLEIVVGGPMARVPFAALNSPALLPGRLSETNSIIMIGSMFDEDASLRDAPRALRLAAVWSDSRASGDNPFPPLTAAGREVRTIADLFQRTESVKPSARIELITGDSGGAAELKKFWSRGADVFHFATHGLADLRQPLTSLLLLPQLDAAGRPTYLTAGQVQEWRGDADLVYLSACETAVGPARFADGMPGLQRAFLRAGARGVVATLWPIEDLYASRFAADFYRRYAAGMPAARALAETQREWSTATADTNPREILPRRMTAWAHVYYTR